VREGQINIVVVSSLGPLLVAILFFYAAVPWIEHGVIPFFGSRLCDTSMFGGIGLFCTFVVIQLFRSKRWAWWVAFVASLAMLALAMTTLFLFLHPRDEFARSEGGFGLFLSLVLMVPSAVSTLLLSLPSTRRQFSSATRHKVIS
jgi:hypothetical protein